MTSHLDYPALEARLDFVHGRMLELQTRIASLEGQRGARGAVPRAPLAGPPSAPSPSLSSAAVPVPTTNTVASASQHAPVLEEQTAAYGTDGLVRVLAVAGGGAVLLGLAFFVSYAIEQNWLTPGLRFVLAAITAALLTVAAWPIARRGYDAVAGAIGGAGLGGWFTAWLVARHFHELVSGPQTFAALAAGAAACLLIADRLRLRSMAGLATMAACVTPVLVSSWDGRLHELMAYQLLVIVGLVILDARRRWPELPTMGLLATWLLAGSWAEANLQQGSGGAFVAWSALLLLVSAASAWRLISAGCEQAEQTHGYLRLVLAGVATWAATAAAFGVPTLSFAAATALLCAWHLALAVLLRRRGSEASELFLALGWMQAFVVGPVIFEQAALAWWWIAMSVVAMLVPWVGLQRLRGAMLAVPVLAALGWCLAANEPWAQFVGSSAAVVPLAASLWPNAHATHERPTPWLVLLGTAAWAVITLAHGPEPMVARLTWGLVPVVVMSCWACARPTRQALLVATTLLGLGLFGSLMAVMNQRVLIPGVAPLGDRFGVAVLLLLLAGLGAAIIARVRQVAGLDEQSSEPPSVTGMGLVVAGAFGLALVLGVALASGGSAALGQAGYSLSIAGVGLGLIVAGLRLHDGRWRQAGLSAIAFAAAKVLLVDLAAAAVGWRALSFVGLGAILIGGAFAYSRAYRRASATSSRRA